jgi:hypothetical protein
MVSIVSDLKAHFSASSSPLGFTFGEDEGGKFEFLLKLFMGVKKIIGQ